MKKNEKRDELSRDVLDWVKSKIGYFTSQMVVKTSFSEVWRLENKDGVFYYNPFMLYLIFNSILTSVILCNFGLGTSFKL